MAYKPQKLAIVDGGTGQVTKTLAFDALAPGTTKGDVTVFNGTNNVRLAVGSNGQALKADSTAATGLAWGADSAGLSDPGSNGIVVRTALNTTVSRTITGTNNQVTVVNGDGVAGQPTLSLPQDINTSASMTFGSVSTSGAVSVGGRFTTNGSQVISGSTSAAGNYTVLATDYAIVKTGITGGGDTITLQAAATAGGGRVIIVKDGTGGAGTDNLTIAANGAETIDGANTFVINTNFGSVTMVCDGASGWLVL